MIEILVLIFLTRDIGRLAQRKGLNKNKWKLYSVLTWLGLEILGIITGIALFGSGNLVSIVLMGLTFASASYFILKAQINKRPDSDLEDEISRLGQ